MTSPIAFENERRRHARHAFRAELHYENVGMQTARGIDLSDEGISMSTHEALEPGKPVTLHFVQRNVHVPGVVRNQESIGHGEYRVGVGFAAPQVELVQVLLAAYGTRND